MTFLCQYSNTCQYLGILQILFDAILEKNICMWDKAATLSLFSFF